MKRFFTPKDLLSIERSCFSAVAAPIDEIVRLGNLYLAKLLSFNRVVPLISRGGNQEALAVQLFLSSLAACEFIPQGPGVTICDLGSGGGFPAIPLKIARPDTGWFLVEARQRKCAFLESIVRELGLFNVKVMCRRLENFTPPEHTTVSVATARAGPSVESVLAWAQQIPSLTDIVLFLSMQDAAAMTATCKNKSFYVAVNKKIDILSEIGDLSLVLIKKKSAT